MKNFITKISILSDHENLKKKNFFFEKLNIKVLFSLSIKFHWYEF